MLDFLVKLVDDNKSYNTINVARSALSAHVMLKDGKTIGNHVLVNRFMKGVFNMRPTVSKYKETWDVNVVLHYLRKLSPAKNLSLKQLTLKLVCLLALLSAGRCQTLQLLDLNNLIVGKSSYNFNITSVLKQSRPGTKSPVIKFIAYPIDRRLCVCLLLKEYIERTENLRGGAVSCWSVILSHIGRLPETLLLGGSELYSVQQGLILAFLRHIVRGQQLSQKQKLTLCLFLIS